jgi:hypothetical protein
MYSTRPRNDRFGAVHPKVCQTRNLSPIMLNLSQYQGEILINTQKLLGMMQF